MGLWIGRSVICKPFLPVHGGVAPLSAIVISWARQTISERVAPGLHLADKCLGAGAALGVSAVRGDLFFSMTTRIAPERSPEVEWIEHMNIQIGDVDGVASHQCHAMDFGGCC
jgi:hypothetical protein